MENKTVEDFLKSEGCLPNQSGQFVYCSSNGKYLINLSALVSIHASLQCAELKKDVEEWKLLFNQKLEQYNNAETFIDKLQAECAELKKTVDQMTEVLKGYEQWEADIIGEDKLWWPHRAKDVLSGPIYDKMLALQEQRNAILKNLK